MRGLDPFLPGGSSPWIRPILAFGNVRKVASFVVQWVTVIMTYVNTVTLFDLAILDSLTASSIPASSPFFLRGARVVVSVLFSVVACH